jgi:hypothetical protein
MTDVKMALSHVPNEVLLLRVWVNHVARALPMTTEALRQSNLTLD